MKSLPDISAINAATTESLDAQHET
jgi:hypothetical protein